MAHFQYNALNAHGQTVTGALEAESVSQAVSQLEAQGLTIQSIGYATLRPEPGGSPLSNDSARESSVEHAALERHMARVMEGGRTIAPALHAFADELAPGRRRRELLAVLQILDRGNAAEAAASWQALPAYWTALLGASSSSEPAHILRAFLKELRSADEVPRQWRLVLVYPLLVLGAAAGVMVLLSVLVVPIFRDIFAGFGLRTPRFTQLILTLADWIASGRILIAGAVSIAVAAALVMTGRLLSGPIRDWFGDRFGTFLGRSAAISRFARYAADLLEAEFDAASAARLAGIATGSPRLRRAAARLSQTIAGGSPFVDNNVRPIITATVVHALLGDVPPASRVRLLREVSCCHAERGYRLVSWTRGVIEPIAICLIGLVVGATVVALFLPLFSLIQGLS